MWPLLLVALLPPKPGPYVGTLPPGGVIVEDMAFGPRLPLTCTWFSNFENSRFERCRGPAGDVLPSDGGASLKCLGLTCEQLDAAARKAAHARGNQAPEGSFTVHFIGRVSVHQHQPQYLGDGTSTVLVEKLMSVRKTR